MKLGEFFLEIAVDAEKGELTVGNLIKKMGMLEVATLGEVAALIELAQGFAALVTDSMETAHSLHQISVKTGINITALQRWTQVAKEAGWSGDELASSAQRISKSLVDMRLGAGSSLTSLTPFISFEGIDASKPWEVIERIRKSKELMSMKTPELSSRLEKAGIDPGWMMVLKMRQADIQKAMNNGFVMSDQHQHMLTEVNKEMAVLSGRSAKLRGNIAAWAAPELLRDLKLAVEYIDRLDAFFLKHQDDISRVLEMTWKATKAAVTPHGSDSRKEFFEYIVNLKERMDARSAGAVNPVSPSNPAALGSSRGPISISSKVDVNLNGAVTPDAVEAASRIFEAKDKELRDNLSQQLRREFQ